ncbi:hypothetical protein ABB37_09626 [Leptomonas pyrrhocoris]|uniref:Uncharacterized protein n=1 Tax=Leptomonas pyrrhocoris TaxID=157538 RepID=A0A0N0VCT0_LEPPY|nr:hypothetical protein ABB37_09626 [Leptomonas pyrrhocoris]KPA73702.1 hypothetical protein ABB37_09626 [Leptomonas pyrrhocoris]|eukprot:XP_015652141.1 hypothetical protein ABB37_09626 [Leptomonas pyrrhocoris]
MASVPNLTIYEAWQSTLVSFLVPACVLSAWPVFVIVCAANRAPLKLLCILALVSLADGLLGSCAFPLTHQYAFTPSQNNGLFYAGSLSYWLGGLVLGPVMEVGGARKSSIALSLVGLLGAAFSAQDTFVLTFLGRCCSATATAGLTTLVEYLLYAEARLPRGGPGEGDEQYLDKEHHPSSGSGGGDPGAGIDSLGGGVLTMYHQLRPLMLWAAMRLGQYAMFATPMISTGPCWAATVCYAVVVLMVWKVFPLASRRKKLSGDAGAEADGLFPGLVPAKSRLLSLLSSMLSPAVLRWGRCFASTYAVSIHTLLQPKQVARHLVDILFGGLFLVLSLLWVPTLEMYDDSIPFGFIFQIFMIARFLGSTISLPVWAAGWAEAALVLLLSVAARVLNTSRDYAIPVTIMLAGVVMHLVAGVAQTTGSLWRAEYPAATAPLTFLFLVHALTGISGWLFLLVIDGKYMEDAFVFEARWIYALMWVEAVALAQYIVKRARQHRETTVLPSSGVKESWREGGAEW